MPQLVMHGSVINNEYNPTEMYAVVSYGVETKPLDHNGEAIQEPSTDFDAHLKSHVMPRLAAALAATSFVLTEQIGGPEGCFLPAFIVKRKDGNDVTKDNMAQLTPLLKKAIENFNADKLNSRPGLFQQSAATKGKGRPANSRGIRH